MSAWDSFTAFNGRLDSLFVKPCLDSEGQVDYGATVSSFWQWIQNLRQSPGDYGIPSGNVSDVKRLLDAFFPQPSPNNPIYPTRILSDVGYPEALRKITPIKVQFGLNNDSLLVADAPNALGYIFSIQKPPNSAARSVFGDYLLPLAVSYAWALHLAFLLPSSASAETLTNVPAEATIVYSSNQLGNSSSSAPFFCFGATWSGADPADAYGAGLRSDNEAEMDRWRRKLMVEPLFAGNLAAPKSNFGAYLRRTVARRLNEYILGKNANDSKATPFLDPLFTGVLKIPGTQDMLALSDFIQALGLMIKSEAVQPLAEIIDPEFLISHTKLSPILMEHLYNIVDNMEAPLNDAVQFMQNLQKLLSFYITPHVLDPISGQEVPIGPQSKPIIDGLANTLPPLLLVAVKQKLHSLSCHLNNTHESTDPKIQDLERLYFIENNQSYTRSPELFPVYALNHGQEVGSPSITNLSGIRGLNIFTRPLGQAIWRGAFQESFSAEMLDKATFQNIQGQEYQDAVVGPPGAEGGVLVQLPEAQINGNLESYIQDAKSVCPRTFNLFEK